MAHILFECPHCGKTFKLMYFHAGFADVEVIYCNKCFRAIQISLYDPLYEYLHARHFIFSVLKVRQEIEKYLKPCSCGGRFLFKAKPRCPFCLCEFDRKDIKKQWSGYRLVYAFVVILSGEEEVALDGKKDIWGDISDLKEELSYFAEKYDKEKFRRKLWGVEEDYKEPMIPIKRLIDVIKFAVYYFFLFAKFQRSLAAKRVLEGLLKKNNRRDIII